MKYTRRGRFLDSDNGKWVIEKNLVTGNYYLYNKENGLYVTEQDGITRRGWGYLRDVKNYIENWAKGV